MTEVIHIGYREHSTRHTPDYDGIKVPPNLQTAILKHTDAVAERDPGAAAFLFDRACNLTQAGMREEEIEQDIALAAKHFFDIAA